MTPNNEYIPVELQPPLRGLATSPPSTRLEPMYSPNLLNCSIREDGIVRRRPGYTQLGRRLVGRVLGHIEFGALGEDPVYVVFTSHRQYYYDTVTQDWVDLTSGQQSYTINTTDVNFVEIDDNHTFDFPTGRMFAIVNSSDADGAYTVATATYDSMNNQTRITTVETIPGVPLSDGQVVVADDMTTGERDQIDFEDVTDVSGRRLIVTNGQDRPRIWTGDTSTAFAQWMPDFTDFVTCKTIRVFNEHLMLGGVVTTDIEPQTIAWSTAGDFEDFESGTSGVQILYQLVAIRAMEILGDRLIIYSDDAIMSGVFVDEPAIFAFDVVIPHGTRFVGLHGLVSINVGHIYLSEQSMYLFDGSRGLRPIGDQIITDYRATKDQENLHLVGSINDFAKRTIFFSVPDINGGAMIYTMFYDVFNLGTTTWCREKYAHAPRSFGFFTNRDEEITWEDTSWEVASNPWEDEFGAWGEEAEQLRFPIRTFGTNDGDVFIVTETSLTDDGTEATQRYDTKDFTIPEVFQSLYGRWGELEIEAFGGEVDISYSVDEGRNFTSLSTQTLTDTPNYYRVPFDVSGRTLRIRFESTQDFALRWARVWVRGGGPR